MKIIDTHTHLNVEPLLSSIDEVISRAKEVGVEKVINNADSIESFSVLEDLSLRYKDFCYQAIGLFPLERKDFEKDMNALRNALRNNHNVVALGEVGLDYHYEKDEESKREQKKYFEAQIAIAKEFNLPLIIHSREADEDTFNILMNSGFENNITLHCYSGSKEMALRYIKNHKNTFFGIGGVVTFSSARRLVEVVKEVSLSNLLLETDAPYLTPSPFRGKTNEPSYLTYVIKKIAEIKELSEEEVAETLYQNAKRVYNLWADTYLFAKVTAIYLS